MISLKFTEIWTYQGGCFGNLQGSDRLHTAYFKVNAIYFQCLVSVIYFSRFYVINILVSTHMHKSNILVMDLLIL